LRKPVRDFIKIIAENVNFKEPVYEFGACQYDQSGDADIREFFGGKVFIGCDIQDGKGVDKVLDLHNIDLPDNSVNTIFIIDVIEHVKHPFKAFNEIFRVLKDDGIVVFSSVMDYEIHGNPYDYWRFTPDGFKVLLENFKSKEVFCTGYEKFPHSVIGIGVKNADFDFGFLDKFIPEWRDKWDYDTFDTAVLQARINFLEEQLLIYKSKLNETFFTKLVKQIKRTFTNVKK